MDNQKTFKENNRQDICTKCPKRIPCAFFESICELVTPCAVCEIKETCNSICDQMTAYIQRGNSQEKAIPFSRLKLPYKHENQGDDRLWDYLTTQYNQNTNDPTIRGPLYRGHHIPWKAISDQQANIIVDHFIHGKTYEEIAKKYKLIPRNVYSAVHGGDNKKGALETLKTYAVNQRRLRLNRHLLPPQIRKVMYLYYFKYRNISQIAEIMHISKTQVSVAIKNGRKLLKS